MKSLENFTNEEVSATESVIGGMWWNFPSFAFPSFPTPTTPQNPQVAAPQNPGVSLPFSFTPGNYTYQTSSGGGKSFAFSYRF